MIDFKKYQPMIRQFAWKLAKRTGAEFEDLEAEGNLVFCESAQKFKPQLGFQFSTYLWWALSRRLPRWLEAEWGHLSHAGQRFQADVLDLPESLQPTDAAFPVFLKVLWVAEEFEHAPADVLDLLIWILGREWEVPGRAFRPCRSRAAVKFPHWSQERMILAWGHAQQFWRSAQAA